MNLPTSISKSVDYEGVSGRVNAHGQVPPRERTERGEVLLFPREVVAVLELGGIDYRQLRRLLVLVRKQAGVPKPVDRGWARYSLADVAALEVALELAGGREALAPGRHLQMAPVARACAALRERGIDNPLLDVPMRRDGRKVFAFVNGTLLDPTNGQAVMQDAADRVGAFLSADRSNRAEELLRRLRQAQDWQPTAGPVQVGGGIEL